VTGEPPPTTSSAAHSESIILRDATVAAFAQVDTVDTVECMAGYPDIPSDPAVVVLNPDDEITSESFAAWLDRRQAGKPVDPGVRAADTLAEARATGEA
jgi:hypothetical protein